MKIQSILMAAAFCVASVSLASAKTYDVHLSNPALAGSVQLPAGEYHLKVDGAQAVFTDVTENKSFTTQVNAETVPQKYDATAVVTNNQDGTQHISSIELGGSKTKLEFK